MAAWAGSGTPEGNADQAVLRKAVLGTLMMHEQPPFLVHWFAACLLGISRASWPLSAAWAYLEHCTYGVLLLHCRTDHALPPPAPCASTPAPVPSPHRALSPRPVLLNKLQQAQQVGAAGCSRVSCDRWACSCTPDGKADQPLSRKAVLGTLTMHEQLPVCVHWLLYACFVAAKPLALARWLGALKRLELMLRGITDLCHPWA